MKKATVVGLALLGLATAPSPASTQDQAPAGPAQLLNQGWSDEDRLRYYFTSQGSAVMPYDLFLHLEEAGSSALFRSDPVVAGYGLVPQAADPAYNPDGLPIGVTRTRVAEGRWQGDWVGLTCAACHNGLLEYRGTSIRIDGGVNNRFDFSRLIDGLDRALAATLASPDKLGRLAAKLGSADEAGKAKVAAALQTAAAEVHDYVSRSAISQSPFGPGRMDALGLIHNRVAGLALGVPENWAATLAPTKPPFVWNAPQSSWVQWTGIASNPLARNGGESLGVYVKLDLTSKTREDGLFDSTMDVRGLIEIEELLRKLAPPKWPEAVLGPIDRAKAAAGKTLFAENCAECHSVYPHRWSEPKLGGKLFIENALVPLRIVGTDPMQFRSSQFDPHPSEITGVLAPYLPAPHTNAPLAPYSVISDVVGRATLGKALAKLDLTEAQLLDATGYAPPGEAGPPQPVYKAGPRDGIWATPPFFHNGSVPNLYEVLLPAEQRSKTFLVGSEFDPVKVGVDTSGTSGTFLFDTRLVGNSNAGHSFQDGPMTKGVIGRLLTEDERYALIEYLKSIPDADAQVTPYGGPADPVEAWKDPTFFHNRHKTSYGATYGAAEPAAATATASASGEPALGEERVGPGEAALIDSIVEQTLDRLAALYPAEAKPVLRDAHPKTHGLVRAEFIVADGLPPELRHGVFAEPRTFDALIRFSAGGLDVRADTEPQARGMAIKLLGVAGRKILEDERDASTQDFVMINYPTFFVRNLEDYATLHGAMADGMADGFYKSHPAEQAIVREMAAQRFNNPLQVRYWSQTPYKLGPHAIKFSARPVTDQSNKAPAVVGPDYLREALVAQVGASDVYFEFLVQVQADPAMMPVEDPVVAWKEADAPFQRVALIRIPKQDTSSPATLAQAEQLSFTPWHALPEHRPLGAINRARRAVYQAVSLFRHEANGAVRVEPETLPN